MAELVWKEFEENQLTHSAAHYLMTIEDLLADNGYARVTDVAKRLNITRGSASIGLKPLKKRELVLEDENETTNCCRFSSGMFWGSNQIRRKSTRARSSTC